MSVAELGYDDEYIKRLEEAARLMAHALEDGLSVIEPGRAMPVKVDAAIRTMRGQLSDYYKLQRDFCNE